MGRRIGGDKLRVSLLQFHKLVKQSVIFRVRDLRTIEDIVSVVVIVYPLP